MLHSGQLESLAALEEVLVDAFDLGGSRIAPIVLRVVLSRDKVELELVLSSPLILPEFGPVGRYRGLVRCSGYRDRAALGYCIDPYLSFVLSRLVLEVVSDPTEVPD